MSVFKIVVLYLLLVVPSLGSAHSESHLSVDGYYEWTWLHSDCQNCEIIFLSNKEELNTIEVNEFVEALVTEKENLMRIYKADGQEYTLLSHMAIGILGRESLFFKSHRYFLKENFPSMVRLLKIIRMYLSGKEGKVSPNSRGPTQIKIIPKTIVKNYHFKEDELYIPKNAAVATMGYLIEGLRELKRRITLNDLGHINETNYVDYLPYIYFGGKRRLINKTATPETNIYVKDMKRYMSWVLVYERKPQLLFP